MGYANIDDTHTTIPGVFDAPPDFSFIEAETTWAGSLRGRAGYLITPSVHLYGTAGVAVASAELEAVCPADTDFCNPAFGTIAGLQKSVSAGHTASSSA